MSECLAFFHCIKDTNLIDPVCGSGGMFVQSMKFIEHHNGNKAAVSIIGQEKNPDTRRLAKMNLAIRGISYDLGVQGLGESSSFTDDQHKDMKVDYIMANSPFNLKDCRGENELLDDPRWQGYEQLIYYPLVATANLYEMYYAQAINWKSDDIKIVNQAADKVEWCFKRDTELTSHYHSLNDGKWEHMMGQTHIGYHDWQEPEYQSMPELRRLKLEINISKEVDQSIVIEAADFNEKTQGEVVWTEIADMGRSVSTITTLPNTIIPTKQDYVRYDFETVSSGEFQVEVFLSPSLNWNSSGLIYGYQIDNESEVEVNFNGNYKGELGNWQAERIIRSLTVAKLEQGKHRLLFYAKTPDVVLQKIVLHFGEIKETYLGRNHSDFINSGLI